MLSGKVDQAVRRLTDHGVRGFLLPGDDCINTGRPVVDIIRYNHLDIRVPLAGDSQYYSFEDYIEVLETVHIEFLEDNVTWGTLKLSGAEGSMGAEAADINHCLLRFGCTSEDLHSIVADLSDWITKS